MSIRQLVVVGGGTAGWMTAARLNQALKPAGIRITLIESPSTGTVGVGEATLPGLRQFYRALGMNERALMKATNATAKLGIEFENWCQPGHRFFHPFGVYGEARNNLPFHGHWLARASHRPLEDFCLASQLVKAKKFSFPHHANPGFAVFDWALHLDATAFADQLRMHATAQGVDHLVRHLTGTRQNDNGDIAALNCDDGSEIAGDFFIDCSGFSTLLLGSALGACFEDWSDYLPCNRAVVVQSDALQNPPPFTRSIACRAGWRWKIPLQNRTGNGYVYCDKFCSPEQAEQELIDALADPRPGTLRHLKFTAGVRPQSWTKNCVAIWLAAGFIEPLESTSISLIETAIERLLRLFPTEPCAQQQADEYNRLTYTEYLRIRDFIQLHYVLSQRTDTAFWRFAQSLPKSETLQRKIATYRTCGHIIQYDWESFAEPSWLSLFEGMQVRPATLNPLLLAESADTTQRWLEHIANAIASACDNAEPHARFIQQYAH